MPCSQDGFVTYRTNQYKLHYYETPTGLKFVINTDPLVDSLRVVLRQIYTNFYVEFVVKNALSHASVFLFLAFRFSLAAILMALFRPKALRGLKREELLAGAAV